MTEEEHESIAPEWIGTIIERLWIRAVSRWQADRADETGDTPRRDRVSRSTPPFRLPQRGSSASNWETADPDRRSQICRPSPDACCPTGGKEADDVEE
jgi:hypothetical protein